MTSQLSRKWEVNFDWFKIEKRCSLVAWKKDDGTKHQVNERKDRCADHKRVRMLLEVNDGYVCSIMVSANLIRPGELLTGIQSVVVRSSQKSSP